MFDTLKRLANIALYSCCLVKKLGESKKIPESGAEYTFLEVDLSRI